jgi:hypothetical protein
LALYPRRNAEESGWAQDESPLAVLVPDVV